MIPVIALVGRPNVGKSTLFNQLTRSREALVANFPGLTRERKYGEGRLGEVPFIAIDTGGITGEEAGIDSEMAGQSLAAIDEALWVEAREGGVGVVERARPKTDSVRPRRVSILNQAATVTGALPKRSTKRFNGGGRSRCTINSFRNAATTPRASRRFFGLVWRTLRMGSTRLRLKNSVISNNTFQITE